MKKKIFLMLAIMAMLVCAFAISVSAASLSNFINVELTLDDDSKIEAYLEKGSVWSDYQGYSRVTLYTDYTDKSQTIDWSRVRVFDGRNSTIHTYDGTTLTDTGAFAQTLLGYPKNVSNVTHFYYTQGSVIIADNSFNITKEGWNIEYLYVPKSVKILGTGICSGSTKLTTVEFEKGSQLEDIKDSAFRECISLSSINLQDTMLKKIHGADGYSSNGNAFRKCTSLTSVQLPQTVEYIGYNAFFASGLSGTMVLPNSVTHLGPGSFLATPIETLVIGDGPVTIGFNFVGSFSDNNISFENTYLKEVYIPSEATLEKAGETWCECTEQVTFYVVGRDCTAIINSLKTPAISNHMTIGMADDENAETYDGIIVEGTNPCTVFHNGEHSVSNGACVRCGEPAYCTNPEHNLKIDVSYESYLSEGEKSTVCLDCNSSPFLTKTPALFTCLGYSAKIGGTKITVGYSINKENLSLYEQSSGKTLKYGVVAYVPNATDNDADNMPINNDMTLKNPERTIFAEVEANTYAGFNFILNGFDEESYGIELIMSAFVYDGEKVYYLGANGQSEVGEVITFDSKITE